MHEQKTIKRGSRMHEAGSTFRGKRGWFCQNLLKFFRLKPIQGIKFEAKFHKILVDYWLNVFRGIFQNHCLCMCTPAYLSAPLGHYIYSNIDLNKMKDIDTQCYSLISIFAQKLSYFFLHESSITSNLHHTVFFFSCFIIKFIYWVWPNMFLAYDTYKTNKQKVDR